MSNKVKTINVGGSNIEIININNDDFISLTDMARIKKGESRAADIIKNWIRSRTTLEFIGTWEQLYNPNFKVVEFDHFKMQAGLSIFKILIYKIEVLKNIIKSLKLTNQDIYLSLNAKKNEK